MEENQNKGIDLSHYLDSRRASTFAQLSALEKDKEKTKKKNKIYLAIIVVCFLVMAVLWISSSQRNSEVVDTALPAEAPAQ